MAYLNDIVRGGCDNPTCFGSADSELFDRKGNLMALYCVDCDRTALKRQTAIERHEIHFEECDHGCGTYEGPLNGARYYCEDGERLFASIPPDFPGYDDDPGIGRDAAAAAEAR